MPTVHFDAQAFKFEHSARAPRPAPSPRTCNTDHSVLHLFSISHSTVSAAALVMYSVNRTKVATHRIINSLNSTLLI